jgi:Ca2+/Na+ antiporter
MTRTQFLLLLYKKLFRPALVLLLAYYTFLFAVSLATGKDSSWDMLMVIVCVATFILVVYGLQQGADYLISKLLAVPAVTAPKSETSKVISRLSDIALGMALLYIWQINPGYAIGWGAAILMGMRNDYKKQQVEKAE